VQRDVRREPFHIVLVEDSETDAFLVREAFRHHRLDFRLDVLADGELAVDFVDRLDAGEPQHCPDFFMLDLNLPKVTGDVLLKLIRKSRRCSQVPVMIITSSSSPRDEEEMMRLGATCYFHKPSRLSEFLNLGAVVSDLLNRPGTPPGDQLPQSDS
jgi:DNA-binding response OmpR family regulator